MRIDGLTNLARGAAFGVALSLGAAAAPAIAAPIYTAVNADLTAAPYTFSFKGESFTVTGTGAFPDYLAVSTTGGAAVRTVFGTPSVDFGRASPTYDSSTLGGYGSFASLTTVPTSNGPSYLGLRVTSGGQDYYGFLFTTDTTLNSYGFETRAGAGITATAAVPEPAAWTMMILGMGVVGFALRRRNSKVSTTVTYG